MVKKVKKAAGSQPSAQAPSAGPGLLDSQFGQLVKESAQQIWSAGLAAFAKAQNSSGKAFDTLAAEGERLQKKTQASTEERLGTVASRMSDMAGEVGTRAGQHWDKLESIFEDRVARALQRLGVPTSQDLAALQQKLDALTQAIQAQGGEAAVPAGKTRKASGPTATAAKAGKAAKAETRGAGKKAGARREADPPVAAEVESGPGSAASKRTSRATQTTARKPAANAAVTAAAKAAARTAGKTAAKPAAKAAIKPAIKPATTPATKKPASATRAKR